MNQEDKKIESDVQSGFVFLGDYNSRFKEMIARGKQKKEDNLNDFTDKTHFDPL